MKKYNNLLDWATGNSVAVPVLSLTTSEEVQTHGQQPFVLRDRQLLGRTDNWTPEHIRRELGGVQVGVYVSVNGTFPGGRGPYDPTQYLFKQMPLAECIDRMSGSYGRPILKEGEKYYLYQQPAHQFEKLIADIDLSRYFPQGAITKNFWLSGPGNITPIHYDLFDNFLVQLMGRKKVLLWAPNHYCDLNFNPIGTLHDRQSTIDPLHPDGHLWPKAARLQVYTHDLSAGDILYIPYAWSHFVFTEQFSASLNFWWTPKQMVELMSVLRSTASTQKQFELVHHGLAAFRPELLGLVRGLAADGSLQQLLLRPELT